MSPDPSGSQEPDSDGSNDPFTETESKAADGSSNRFISSYRDFRETIVSIEPMGKLVWDTLRIVVGITIILLALIYLTGLSTPLVSVTSGSMEPNLDTNDGLIITKFQPNNPPPLAKHGGIITVEDSHKQNGSHTSIGREGDVIVFKQLNGGPPVVHRAHLWVKKGENWVPRANPELLDGFTSCETLANCPAPNSGYITHGDNNDMYDQAKGTQKPVSHDQVIGVGQYKIPLIGIIPNGIDAITPW